MDSKRVENVLTIKKYLLVKIKLSLSETIVALLSLLKYAIEKWE